MVIQTLSNSGNVDEVIVNLVSAILWIALYEIYHTFR